MAVTIVKKETETKAKPVVKATDTKQETIDKLAVQVDPLYAKKLKVDSAKKVLAKHNKVYSDAVKLFMEHVPDLELKEEEKLEINGDKHIATVGPEGKTREVTSNKLVFDMLNEVQEDLAYELMTFGLGMLDKYLTPEQLEEVIKKGFSGTRGVSVK